MTPWITWTILFAMILGREFYRWRRAIKLNRMLEMLEWREKFVRTRGDVVDLIRRREIAPDSPVATMLYAASSALVRRATSYREFTHALILAVIREAKESGQINHKMKQEIRGLSPDARDVFLRFSEDVHHLLLAYSWLYRLIVWAGHNMPRKLIESGPPRHLRWRRLNDRILIYRRNHQLRDLAAA